MPWARFPIPSAAYLEVTVSPLTTVLTSVVEVIGPLSGRLPTRLQHKARTQIPASAADVLRQLWTFEPQRGEVPEFLNLPRPGMQGGAFGEDLEQLRSTPDRTVHSHLEQFLRVETPSETTYRWADDPERQLSVLCNALSSYWRSVQSILYPDLERRLRREAERLWMLVERSGVSLALNEFHPRIRQVDGELLHRTVQRSYGLPVERIVLAPMVASAQTVFGNLLSLQRSLGVSYIAAASGPLALGTEERASGEDPLERLIGATRARLLRELSSLPATTTDLAEALWVTPPTISHHLKVLATTEVVEAHRVGPEVFYHLTGRGRALLRLWRP